jgi:hypothetical protein
MALWFGCLWITELVGLLKNGYGDDHAWKGNSLLFHLAILASTTDRGVL